MKIKQVTLFLVIVISTALQCTNASVVPPKIGFNVIPLGTSGGNFENNLSSYLVAPAQSKNWIALDAGSLCSGIENISSKTLKKVGIKSRVNLFTTGIKGYLISHAHLDHISGLIMCSTTDHKKPIYGLDSTLNFLQDHIFNWKIWPNFGDEGLKPLLKQYHYKRLAIGASVPIKNTSMSVQAYPLSHGNGYTSTAFLLKSNQQYLLYLGDTGADELEHSHNLQDIWHIVAPLIRKHKLAAIFIESSYANHTPDNALFGHLSPRHLHKELLNLANIVDTTNPTQALKGLPIVVTHIKQGLEPQSKPPLIMHELNENNNLGVIFILPHSGSLLQFSY